MFGYGLGSIMLIVQILVAYHAIKTGRSFMWIFLVIFVPLLGVVLYFLIEILPELRDSRASRKAFASVSKALNPGGELRRNRLDLEIADTVENKVKLARSHMEHGAYDDAVRLLESAATGIHKTDPEVLRQLAEAYFQAGRHADARDALDRLLQANPGYKSPEGHLLYARALDALGETDKALSEYQAVAGYYPGAEAKYRYGAMLKRLGRQEEARRVFQELLTVAERAPAHYRKAQKEWLGLASRDMA